MRRISLRLRVTLAFALVMALVLAAMSAFVFVRVHNELTAAVDRDLRSQLADAGRHENDRGGEGGSLLDPGSPGIAQVLSPDGAVVAGSPPAMLTASQLRRASTRTVLFDDARLPGHVHRWRMIAAPDPHGNVVVVAESLQRTDEALGHLVTELAIAVPIALLLASLAGYQLAAAALRPVEAMRRRASGISAETPGRRLPVPDRDDEIARLGTTLNQMLERIEAAVEHERRFVADASHELRTPLALLKTELDLALRRPRSAAELEDALRSALVETDRLAQIAEDLLLLARSEDGTLPLQLIELEVQPLLADVRDRFAVRATLAGRGLAVVADEGLRLLGDRLRLEQALDNLVGNALDHGAGDVTLAAETAGDRVELHVRDRGGGFPPEFLESAFERFSRADEARGRGGSGLGLAIVDLIARAHGGVAAAANVDEGADVWLSLPALPEPEREDDRGLAAVRVDGGDA